MYFFAVLNSDFESFRSKISSHVCESKIRFQKTHTLKFISVYFIIQSVNVFQTVILEYKMSHGRGFRKVPKKVSCVI